MLWLCPHSQVKDPRFEWTRDKTLVLKEVTHSDQGLYANKLSIGFTYETVHLIVSGKITSLFCGINLFVFIEGPECCMYLLGKCIKFIKWVIT